MGKMPMPPRTTDNPEMRQSLPGVRNPAGLCAADLLGSMQMPASPEFEIRAEPGRNLLRIHFVGDVTPAGMKACVANVELALAKLHPGLTVLTDLTRLHSMALDCVTPLTRMMDRFRTSGVKTVVRVIPDPTKDIGFNILALTHYRGVIRVVTCASAAEAESRLPRPAGNTAASTT